MPTHLESIFPNLRPSSYKKISPQTRTYNCVSWAASENRRLWWPIGSCYWPPDVPREETLDSFILAFRTLGYEPCDDHGHEEGYEKVAIYTDSSNTPTHVARQLNSRWWTSKIGGLEDIKHKTLQGLEGAAYGKVVQVLKRPQPKEEKSILSSVLGWLSE